jgi:hypothetical protein
VALAAGLATAYTYLAFDEARGGAAFFVFYDPRPIFFAALRLMLPTSLLSGLLFTLLGKALKERCASAARAAGALTLANTTGAMCGALLAAFLLLPRIGIERSLYGLCLLYGVVTALAFAGLARQVPLRPRERQALAVATALSAGYLALFPFGLMQKRYLPVAAAPWVQDGSKPVAVREGLTETIQYMRRELLGQPIGYRLVTNGISMSGTSYNALRYMKMFVYWPVAVHGAPKRALLISYGVGATAKALSETPGLASIDVVDISRDILELGRVVFPPPAAYPLDDPRVRVHVEDGRFFLLTTRQSYDLITAEPPPPKNAGIVNLYSREYFQMLRERLAPGGLATYWLPVDQLEASDGRAIMRGFCDAFEDCSLWSGFGPEWMLAGTREARGPVSEEAFSGQWREPGVAEELRALGFDRPELLGSTFLADAETLRAVTAGAPALEDNHPLRLSHRRATQKAGFFLELADPGAAAERFANSAFVARLWPAALRERTLRSFPAQAAIDRFAWAIYGWGESGVPELYASVTQGGPRASALWLLGVSATEERIARASGARAESDRVAARTLAAAAFADRDYLEAERRLKALQRVESDVEYLGQWRVLALYLAGQRDRAAALLAAPDVLIRLRDRRGWDFLAKLLGAPSPFAEAGSPGR